MKKLNIGLTGICGYGSYYLEFLLHNPFNKNFNFVAIVDPFAKNSEYYKELIARKILIYDTQKDFYNYHQVDLMIISTPIQLHREHSEYAIKHGSHVLCEKPTAALVSDVEKMIKTSKKYDKEIFVGFQLPFTDPMVNLKNDLLHTVYGKVISAKSLVLVERDDAYYNRSSGWAGKIYDKDFRAIYDSVASNATAHYLYILLFLLGDTPDTSAQVSIVDGEFYKANPIESFDTSIIHIKTKKDQNISFIASHATNGIVLPKFEIICENAKIYFDASNEGIVTVQKNTNQIIEYGFSMKKDQDYQKILKTIDWLSDKKFLKPLCTAKTTIPFIDVINRVFTNFEFKRFDDSIIKYDTVKKRFYVENLYKNLIALYDKT